MLVMLYCSVASEHIRTGSMFTAANKILKAKASPKFMAHYAD